jgi:uracil-DNA glycosylase
MLKSYPPVGWEALFRTHFWDDRSHRAPSQSADALIAFVQKEYQTHECYPAPAHVLRAFETVPFDQVRVVILGQDPYHEPGQAHGLSFSVTDGTKLPPWLRNIYKEMYADLGIPSDTPLPTSGDLSHWAGQGVLLLNSVLTVRRGEAASHRGCGWEQFTDAVLCALDASKQPIAFVLWGKDARAKRKYLTNADHLVIESDHPSPLSAWRGFFGSRPFSRVNEYLVDKGCQSIEWLRE